jgi:integrase
MAAKLAAKTTDTGSLPGRAGRLTQDAAYRAVARGEPCTLRDEEGLLLVIGKRKRAWFHEYRLPGRDPASGKRRLKKLLLLGNYGPAFRLADARRENAAARARVAAGHDVLAERRAERSATLAAAADNMTMSGLIRSYVALRSDPWRPQTRRAFAADLGVIEAALGAVPVAAVTRARLSAFLQNFIAEQQQRGRRGTRVERVRMLIGSLFGHAIELDLIAATPAVRLRLPASARVAERERVLNADELAATWRTLEQLATPAALALQLSLVTGARIGAVALAAEGELVLNGRLDGDTDGKPVWRIPGTAGRKAKTTQVLPLSPLAVTLWRRALAWPGRSAGDPAFPGKPGKRPLQPITVSDAWKRWRRAGLVPAGTVAHDLRRSARSWWSGLDHGQSRDTLERLLGHAVGGKVERIYDRARYVPQQRTVADAWAHKLIAITAGPAPVLSLPLRRRA